MHVWLLTFPDLPPSSDCICVSHVASLGREVQRQTCLALARHCPSPFHRCCERWQNCPSTRVQVQAASLPQASPMPPTQNLPLALCCWLISTMAPCPRPTGKTLTLQGLAPAFRFSKGGFLHHIRFLEILRLPQISVQPLQGLLRASQRDGIFLASCISKVTERPLSVMLGGMWCQG